jgi:hypothetical protein
MGETAREDDAFVAGLLAILTNPEPTDIATDDPYRQAEDGIDRYNGFGTDVWVESLRVVEGEYGAELEVTIGLAVPSGERSQIPSRAVSRVLFERRWRELSGYGSPAEYAPYVARQVESAASSHIRDHRARAPASPGRGPTRRPVPARDVQWRLLLDGLAAEAGPAVEVAPGRIEVRIADRDDRADADSEVVTVIVTPDQWEDVLAAHGSRNVGMYVAERLGPRDSDEHFVVYYGGDLVRSIREELPPVRGTARARRFAAEGAGGWYAVAPRTHRNRHHRWETRRVATGDDDGPGLGPEAGQR